jgi:haloalkane dehalogenase
MSLVALVAHCIAPDLIGFGHSGKPDIAYHPETIGRSVRGWIAGIAVPTPLPRAA